MATLNVLGMDYGSSGGRAILGRFDGKRLGFEEILRFKNPQINLGRGIYWDFLALYYKLMQSVQKAQALGELTSLAIDCWASDFGLLDKHGNLLSNPVCYRDPRTETVAKEVYEKLPPFELFKLTGAEPHHRFAPFHLAVLQKYAPGIYASAGKLLFISGIFNYFLTGEQNCDITQASSSVMYNPLLGAWDKTIIDTLGIDGSILPQVTKPGFITGKISKSVCADYGVRPCTVINIASHDTASAVAAVPADTKNAVFISSGSWSVIGTSIDEPIINRQAFDLSFSNEAAYGGGYIFVKNITGLWILQELEREWAKRGVKLDYAVINNEAGARAFASYIDPTSHEFALAGDMEKKVCSYCAASGQKPPETVVEYFSAVINGIAHKYKDIIAEISLLTGKNYDTIYIVGGGSQIKYKSNLTAAFTGKKVISGNSEATIAGNIITQLIALGEIKDINEAWQIEYSGQ